MQLLVKGAAAGTSTEIITDQRNASYSQDHYPITKELLKNGFNVLVEKPFARNYYECMDLIRIAKEKQVVLSVFQQTFLAPFYTETKKIIESKMLGTIKQIDIRYNGFSRRWDWQTMQSKMAGSAYNTGPHPIGLALDLLGFDENIKVIYSKLDCVLTSGDAEDYVKIILTAPQKPVVDVEISAIDAFSDYTLKIQGSKGTYKCTTGSYQMKYIVEGENPEKPLIVESLKDENGYPVYCQEKLITHEETGDFEGSAFNVAVERFYDMLYRAIADGEEMEIHNEDVARIIQMIECVHGQNPLPVKF